VRFRPPEPGTFSCGALDLVRRWAVPLIALWLTIAHLATFDITKLPLVTDIRFYAYFAAETAAGAVPHLDFFDHKTQLATLIGALLHRLGTLASLDPLLAIRAGYLVLVALHAALVFIIFRRLGRDSQIAGLIGLVAFFSFPLLGLLPATGNVPKALMALLASAAVVLVHRRKWFAAGFAGVLAAMDWQVGIVVLAAVLAAALLSGDRRWRRTSWVLGGALAASLLFLAYFAWHGALGVAVSQCVGGSLIRASEFAASHDLAWRLHNLADVVQEGCRGQSWLLGLALPGLVAFPFWMRRFRGTVLWPPAVVLAVYHYGLICFSLFDFQRFGDLFILLNSVVFFLGVAVLEADRWMQLAAGRARGDRARRRAGGLLRLAVILATVLAARPAFLRPDLVLETWRAPRGTSLADQREVGRQLLALAEGRTLAFADRVELLFLAGLSNDLPFGYWNRPLAAYLARSPFEGPAQTWFHLLTTLEPDVIVPSSHTPMRAYLRASEGGQYRRLTLRSNSGACAVELWLREDSDASPAGAGTAPSSSSSGGQDAHLAGLSPECDR